MSRYLTTISFTTVFLFALSSCAGKTIPSPKSLEPPIQPVMTNPPTMIVKNTLTTSPTSTLEATRTKALPSPTPFLLKTKFPKACQNMYFDEWTKISPSGDWLAESCSVDGTMQISNQDGTKIFSLNSKDYFYDPIMPELIGSVEPAHWTNDSLFIYFTVTPEQWNDGGFMMTLDVYAPLLARMNIENGETSEIFRGGMFYHSFSPTDRRLIEIQQSKHPTTLIIHDLKTGATQTLTPNNDSRYSQAANIVWSPDGLKFVFVAAFGPDFGDEANQPNIQSLILVDTANLSQRIIISETSDLIKPISWDENDLVIYQTLNYENRNQITTYGYHYQTDEITPLPTIVP